MSENAIVVREPEQAGMVRYGDRDSLELLANRIGMFFAVGADKKTEEMRKAELTAARPALLKAAQLTYQYGYVPGMDVYVIKRGKSYSAEPSLEAWKKTADRHAFIGRFRYTVDVEELTAEEVKAQTDPDVPYDPEDKGARARLFRFDVAREMKELGIPYRPTWHYGFWRKNAREETEWDQGQQRMVKTGRWAADQVPAQRTRQDVAVRRAHRAAIMAEFPMIPLDDFAERIRVSTAMRYLDAEIAERGKPDGEEAGATFVQPTVQYEEDGDVLFATEQPRPTIKTSPTMAAGQAVNLDGWGDWATAADYAAAIDWAKRSGHFNGATHVDKAWAKHVAFVTGLAPSEVLAKWRDYVNGHDKKGGDKEAIKAVTTPVTMGTEGSSTTHKENGSGATGGSPAAVSPAWQAWQKADDMYEWAVEQGHYETHDQARVAFANMLSFKGLRYTKQTVQQVHEAWFEFHPAKDDADQDEDFYNNESIEDGEYKEVA